MLHVIEFPCVNAQVEVRVCFALSLMVDVYSASSLMMNGN